MKKHTDYVLDREGNAVAGAEVYVRKQSDNTLASLYSDDGVTPTSNPVTTDNDGEFSFYAGDDTYKLQVYIEGVQQEVNHVLHYDASAFGMTLIDDADAATARATLGLTLGTNVQAYDATLAALASFNTNGVLCQTAADTFAGRTITGTANELTVTNGDGVAGAPTLSLPSALTFTGKTITGGSVTPPASPTTTSIGYLGCPQNQQDANYTTVMADAGKHLYHTSGSTHTWTIDSNANVAYPIGTILTFINADGGGDVTIAITSDTLRWGSSTGSRTLPANAVASAIKTTSTTWRMTGDGIS